MQLWQREGGSCRGGGRARCLPHHTPPIRELSSTASEASAAAVHRAPRPRRNAGCSPSLMGPAVARRTAWRGAAGQRVREGGKMRASPLGLERHRSKEEKKGWKFRRPVQVHI